MTEQMEAEIVGVVCLHCGLNTPVSKTLSGESSTEAPASGRPKISIIRCTECGGEVPYLAEEIAVLKKSA